MLPKISAFAGGRSARLRLLMRLPLLLIFGLAFLEVGCINKSGESISFSSYEPPVEASNNTNSSFVCYSKDQLHEMFTAFQLPQELRNKFENVNFNESLVCAIKNFRIVDVVGREGMGFIRVKQESTNGVGVAVIKRKANRF